MLTVAVKAVRGRLGTDVLSAHSSALAAPGSWAEQPRLALVIAVIGRGCGCLREGAGEPRAMGWPCPG